jgi:hypothetical protein
VNKHEAKQFELLQKLREGREFLPFCKLFKIYFEGVLSLSQFF